MTIMGNHSYVLNDEIMCDQKLCEAFERALTLDMIISMLKTHHEMARVQIEKLVWDKFGISTSSAIRFEDTLVSAGLIRVENRKEETIKVNKKEEIYYNKEKQRVPYRIRVIVENTGEVMEIRNPACCYSRFERVEREVQVTRKYWVWIG